MKMLTAATLVLWATVTGAARAQDPFAVDVELTRGSPSLLQITFGVPAAHYLYVHMLQVEPVQPPMLTLTPMGSPPAKHKYDDALGREVAYYDKDVTLTYRVEGLTDTAVTVAISYQGCTESMCFLPQRREITVKNSGTPSPPIQARRPPEPVTDSAPWRALAERFDIIGTAVGYMAPREFVRFLRESEQGTAAKSNLLDRVFRRYGLVAALLLVIPLGLLLNLTPCVLPMIPVNLAIIGAGQAAGTKSSGFARGALYGAGMALVYGVLGVIVVLTGSRFGALNASPWFNAAIAVVFVVLGLAMFDLLVVDLSRFQRGRMPDDRVPRSPKVTAFLLGGTAALLAGACVAPVLVWVLVLAADLYAKGNPAGLLLPLMLGLGMALPWPVAGAGMAVLPRPGNWMNHVKHGFGVLIFLFAAYYGVLSVRLFAARSQTSPTATQAHIEESTGWNPSLEDGLQEALDQHRLVLVDVWALSCKSCIKMKKTTFQDPEVIRVLATYTRIAFQTDAVDDPTVRGAIDYYHVLGLPTYLVLRPKAL